MTILAERDSGAGEQVANKAKLINLAQKSMSRGHWDKAVQVLEKVLAEDPDDVRTLLKLGDVYAKKGDRSRAIHVYRRVAEHHAEQGFFLKAIAVYKQVLKLDSQNGEAALRIAELHEQLGLAQDALVHYQLALPILEGQSDVDRIVEVLERMLQLDPENVAARIKLAEILSRRENRPGAVRHFAAAAQVLKQQARIEDYVKVAERLIFHDPRRLDVVKDLAKLYLGRGDTKRGLAKLQICFRETPRDVDTLTLLAKAFADLGQVQKTVFVYRELARVHQDEGRRAEARDIHRLILQHQPDDPEALRALGMADPLAPTGADPLAPTGAATDDLDFQMEAPVDVLPFPPSTAAEDATGALPINASRDLRAPTVEPPLEAHYTTGEIGIESLASEPALDVPFSSSELVAPSLAPRPRAPTAEPGALPAPPSTADDQMVEKILDEAKVYIRYNLPGKAIEHLQKAFRVDPQSRVVYRRMFEVYASMGDTSCAAEAMANVLSLARAAGDEGEAEEARAELARLDPGHPSLDGAAPRPADQFADVPPAGSSDLAGDDDEADIGAAEEVRIDTGELAVDPPPQGPRGLPISAFAPDALRAPPRAPEPTFGDVVGDPLAAALGAPVGSRDLHDLRDLSGEPVSDAAFEVDPDQLEASIPDPFDASIPAQEVGAPPATPPPLPAIDPFGESAALFESETWPPPGEDDDLELADAVAALEAGSPGPVDDTFGREVTEPGDDADLDDELDEIGFFIDAELWSDAEEALADLEARHPRHAGVAEVRARLAMARSAPADAPDTYETVDEETEEALAVLGPDRAGPVTAAPTHPDYDQGMAFKQIGQLADAAAAFARAAERSPEGSANALEMLGHCRLEMGEIEDAIEAFQSALAQSDEGDQAANLRYELGAACERIGDLETARAWFEACRDTAPGHRDVESRLLVLGPGLVDASESGDDGAGHVKAPKHSFF